MRTILLMQLLMFLRCDSFVFPASRVSSQSAFVVAPSDEFDDNPDLSGVYVDGFPLPATPSHPDDAQLQSALRQVPITTPLDKPLDSKRDLPTSSQHPHLFIIMDTMFISMNKQRNTSHSVDRYKFKVMHYGH